MLMGVVIICLDCRSLATGIGVLKMCTHAPVSHALPPRGEILGIKNFATCHVVKPILENIVTLLVCFKNIDESNVTFPYSVFITSISCVECVQTNLC